MDRNDPNRFRVVEEGEDEIIMKITELKTCLQEATEDKNTYEQVIALNFIGLAYYKLGDYEMSKSYHNQHLTQARADNNEKGMRRALCNLGCVFKVTGDLVSAREHFEEAMNIARDRDDKRALGKIYNNLANIYELEMNLPEAMRCHKKRLELAKEVGDQNGMGKACASLGNICHVLGNLKSSIEYYEQMLDILRAKLRFQDTLAEDSNSGEEDDFIDLDMVAMQAVGEAKMEMDEENAQVQQGNNKKMKSKVRNVFRRKSTQPKPKKDDFGEDLS